jgi:hypothetical protein
VRLADKRPAITTLEAKRREVKGANFLDMVDPSEHWWNTKQHTATTV